MKCYLANFRLPFNNAEIRNAEGVGVSYENTGHKCQIWHHEWCKPRVMPDLAQVMPGLARVTLQYTLSDA